MSMIYSRPYKIMNWIVVEAIEGKKRKQNVISTLSAAGGHLLEWPAQTFAEYILSYRKKGYFHHLPDSYPYNVDTSLLLRAVAEHIKKSISPTSYLGGAFSVPAHHINRRVTKESDFEHLFNEILSLEDDVGLSQIFRLGEDCNSGKSTDIRAFISSAPVPKKLLTRMSQKIITIGDESSNDIVLGELKTKEEIEEAIQKFFTGE